MSFLQQALLVSAAYACAKGWQAVRRSQACHACPGSCQEGTGFCVPCWHEVVAKHGRNVVIVAVGLAQVGVERPLTELHNVSETVRCQCYDLYRRAKQAIEGALA